MPDALFEGFQLFIANFWIVPVGVMVGMFVGGMPGLGNDLQACLGKASLQIAGDRQERCVLFTDREEDR